MIKISATAAISKIDADVFYTAFFFATRYEKFYACLTKQPDANSAKNSAYFIIITNNQNKSLFQLLSPL